MHRLLAKQLAAATRDGEAVDIDALLAAVEKSYDEFDRERRLSDRAAKLMEDELMAAGRQARREHDAILATILESASDGMLVTRKGGIIETANRSAELQFGATSGALVGQAIGLLMGPAADAISQVAPFAIVSAPREGTGRAVDGRTFPVEFSVNALDAGGFPRQLWIVRDISERIRTQREIVENRLRFQDFAEASSDCFWEIDAALAPVEVHSSIDPTLAARVRALLAPLASDEVPYGVAEEPWLILRQHFAHARDFRNLRLSMVQENGRQLHLALSGKPIFGPSGDVRGYRGTVRDMTGEVAAQEAARRAERHMIEAMDAAPNGIALVDSSLNFLAGNSALRRFARDQREVLETGRPFATFLHRVLTAQETSDAVQTVTELLRALIATGQPREIEAQGLWLLVAARSLSDGGAVLTFSDVTALKQRESEFAEAKHAAESANRLKSQFLATMSHELRTPLNAILGFSEIIRDQVFGTSAEAWLKYAQYSGTIHASGQHLLSLISEILDMSKIEAGTYVLDLCDLDLAEIVSGTVTIISPTAAKSGVTVETDIPDSAMVAADARALRQITLNLLSNAVKFTPQGGRVRCALVADDSMVELSVSDTGIGIAAEDLQSVFEPFRQVDASIRRRHEGTGLGLAITKRLVGLHGGEIAIESTLGAGTTVRVRLPALARAVAAVA